jgi:hypothetical protein
MKCSRAAPRSRDTVTDIIAAVVTREPDWTALPVHTSHRKVLSVSHPLALALYSDASMAAEAAAALHALSISREQISVVAHSHADALTLADRMDARPDVGLEDSRPAALLGELGGHVLPAIALVMPAIGPIVAAGYARLSLTLRRSTASHCFDDGTSGRPSTTAPCIGRIVTPAAASCRHTSKFRSLLNVPAVFRCSVLHTWS